jgi:hypothetical protein
VPVLPPWEFAPGVSPSPNKIVRIQKRPNYYNYINLSQKRQGEYYGAKSSNIHPPLRCKTAWLAKNRAEKSTQNACKRDTLIVCGA